MKIKKRPKCLHECPKCHRADRVYITHCIYPKPRKWFVMCERCVLYGGSSKTKFAALMKWDRFGGE